MRRCLSAAPLMLLMVAFALPGCSGHRKTGPLDSSRRDLAERYLQRAGELVDEKDYARARWALDVSEAAGADPRQVRQYRQQIGHHVEALEKQKRDAGQRALEAGDYRRAERYLSELLVLNPRNRDVREMLAMVSKARLRRPPPAFIEVSPAAASAGATDQTEEGAAGDPCARAEQVLSDGQFERSYKIASAAAAQGRRCASAVALGAAVHQAQQLADAGDRDQALHWYRRAFSHDVAGSAYPQDLPPEWRNDARLLIDEKVDQELASAEQLMKSDLAAAIALLKSTIELDPDSARARLMLKRAEKIHRNFLRLSNR